MRNPAGHEGSSGSRVIVPFPENGITSNRGSVRSHDGQRNRAWDESKAEGINRPVGTWLVVYIAFHLATSDQQTRIYLPKREA